MDPSQSIILTHLQLRNFEKETTKSRLNLIKNIYDVNYLKSYETYMKASDKLKVETTKFNQLLVELFINKNGKYTNTAQITAHIDNVNTEIIANTPESSTYNQNNIIDESSSTSNTDGSSKNIDLSSENTESDQQSQSMQVTTNNDNIGVSSTNTDNDQKSKEPQTVADKDVTNKSKSYLRNQRKKKIKKIYANNTVNSAKNVGSSVQKMKNYNGLKAVSASQQRTGNGNPKQLRIITVNPVNSGYKYSGKDFRKFFTSPIKTSIALFCRKTFDRHKTSLINYLCEKGNFNKNDIINIKFHLNYVIIRVRCSNIDTKLRNINCYFNNDIIYKLSDKISSKSNCADKESKKLFIRNFDIISINSHFEFTQIFLLFGDLLFDPIFGTDKYNDPYAIITYQNLNDAKKCWMKHNTGNTNNYLSFGQHRLSVDYAKF